MSNSSRFPARRNVAAPPPAAKNNADTGAGSADTSATTPAKTPPYTAPRTTLAAAKPTKPATSAGNAANGNQRCRNVGLARLLPPIDRERLHLWDGWEACGPKPPRMTPTQHRSLCGLRLKLRLDR